MNFPPQWIAAAIAAINLFTAARFWWDKRAAIRGNWRVPESELLALAALGGTPAAYTMRRLLRHKTRKQPFVAQLHLIALAQGGALAWWLWPVAG